MRLSPLKLAQYTLGVLVRLVRGKNLTLHLKNK